MVKTNSKAQPEIELYKEDLRQTGLVYWCGIPLPNITLFHHEIGKFPINFPHFLQAKSVLALWQILLLAPAEAEAAAVMELMKELYELMEPISTSVLHSSGFNILFLTTLSRKRYCFYLKWAPSMISFSHNFTTKKFYFSSVIFPLFISLLVNMFTHKFKGTQTLYREFYKSSYMTSFIIMLHHLFPFYSWFSALTGHFIRY